MNELYLTRRQQIETDKILYLESEVNYTNIYTTSKARILAALTLGVIESRLDTKSFLRVNRSYIINLSHLSAFRHENNKLIIRLNGGKEFIASRRRLKTFQNIFSKSSKGLSW
ncbi:LytTR family DNA-binding domain-containing protein [Emticicia sp. W12TSBA100-4]|uniref:LytR/AlgR family response regulator transcription factor n=1 Tax=Emticicia sp. W12TSBA100-4 TaxID=3160965 RepID=UPI003305BF7A